MGDQHSKQPQPPPQSTSDKMFDNIFEFKMMAKQLAKESTKAAAQEKQLLTKVKNAIAKGDYEGAKTIATDCIRKKNEVKRYKVLSSKIDTIRQRLQSAYNTQRLTENMKVVKKKMVGAANTMDMVTMNETMANFEKMFDDLDVNSEMMNQVFDNVNAGVTNENEVNGLIQQVAEENQLHLDDELNIKAGEGGVKIGEQKVQNDQISNDFLP